MPRSISYKNPETFLLVLAFLATFVFSVWQVLLNNFVVERAAFTGVEIGMLQSLREVPGFLAFTAIFLLFLFREQKLILLSMAIMALGVAVTGFFPFTIGLYITTVIMSVGFHYFETLNNSLTLQWVNKLSAPQFMGKGVSVRAFASLLSYGLIWLTMSFYDLGYQCIYMLAGLVGIIFLVFIFFSFPIFPVHTQQSKKIVICRRYWLYYVLVFLNGSRRQIFVVFAAFMMVEKFNFSVSEITLLFMINYIFNWLFAARIGSWINQVGERYALMLEYIGLIIVFVSYAFVNSAFIAAILYVIDHLLFALAIAVNTYFQKIADPKDIAASASLSFTISHVAAVFIPFSLGIVWLYSPSTVFLVGAGFAVVSFVLSCNVPRNPRVGNEMIYGYSSKE